MSQTAYDKMVEHRDDAVLAIEAGDYTTAFNHLLAAQVVYDMTPDTQQDGLQLTYRSIERLMSRVEKLKASSSIGSMGMQRVKVKHIRPENSEDYE